jgi:hypothetical protein
MMFCSPQRLATAVLVGAIALASCSAQTGSMLPSSQSATTLSPNGVHGATYPYIAGTYVGTWKQTAGGSQSGLITIKVGQYISYLWGPIRLKYPTHKAHLGFTGFLTESGKHLSIKMRISGRHTHGTGHATVHGSKLSGTIVLPAHGTVPKIIIAFTTLKKG